MVNAILPAIPRALSAVSEWFCCLLFLLPMKKRFSPCIVGLLLGLAMIGQLGLQYLAMQIMSLPMGFYLGMSMNLSFMFLTMLICGDTGVEISLFWTLYAFSMSELLSSLSWQIIGGFWQVSTLLTPRGLLLSIALFCITAAFIWGMTRSLDQSVERYPRMVLFVVFGITAVQFLGSNLIPSIMPWQESSWMRFSFGLARTLLDFGGVMLLFLFMKTLEEQNRRQQMEAVTRIMNMQYQQHLDFVDTSAYISRQCHDLKHQVSALRSACDPKEQEAYLSELEDMIIRYNSNCNTGNKVLDSILTQKSIYCGQHDLRLSYETDGAILMDLTVQELCVIFGNLLDNAIESAIKVQESENRQVLLEVYQKGGFRVIRVENYCAEPPILKNELPQTTKPDKQMHGYGLKSVQFTVLQHGGTLRCSCDGNWFTATVLLPCES